MKSKLKYLAGGVPVGPLRTIGTLGNPTDAPNQFARVISTTVAVLTVIAGIWFLFILISGGISIMSAGGDKGKYEAAKQKMSTGLVGLIIVIGAVFIIEIVALVIGVPDLLNIDALITGASTIP